MLWKQEDCSPELSCQRWKWRRLTSETSKIWFWLRDPALLNEVAGNQRRFLITNHILKNKITYKGQRCSLVTDKRMAEFLVACVRSWLWSTKRKKIKGTIITFGLGFMGPHPNLNSKTSSPKCFKWETLYLYSIQSSQHVFCDNWWVLVALYFNE